MEKMIMPDKYKKILVEICRILLGAVFVFSGFVKAVDPLGGTYKNEDYFSAFGLEFFNFTALPFSFFLAALEFALGVCLLLGVYRRFHSVLILLFMLFMTPLTLYLAIANPVTDCGCFGDALVISNWETFYKNIVLLTAAFVVFKWYKYMTPVFSKKSQSLVVLYTYLFILGVSFYCYTYLPVLDFRPYKIGSNIPSLMEIPDGAPHDEYETTFIYAKNGVEQEFTMDNYPAGDDTWTFVDSKSKLIKKGYEPPIHDFTIVTKDGDDITDEVLANPSYTFLLVSHKLEKADDANVDKINEVYDFSKQYNYDFYALTASLQDEIIEWAENTGAEYPFCATDDITLKTIVRSNPGLVLIKDGTVINKWPHRRILEKEALSKPLEETKWGQMPPNYDTQYISLLAFILIAPLFLLFLFDFFKYRKQEQIEIQN